MNANTVLARGSDLGSLLRATPDSTPQGPGWLNRLRSEAAARAAQLGLPTKRDEEWRYTDLAPLLNYSFEPVTPSPLLALADIERFIIPEAATSRLVFVDGVFAPGLSALDNLPAGLRVARLAEAWSSHEMMVHAHLSRLVNFQHDVFAALNTRSFSDGALILIGKDQRCPAPVHLLFIATSHDAPVVISPRCLVIAEPGSECTLIEDSVSLGDSVYFNNMVTEIAVAENAQVTHIKLQREAGSAFHIAHSGVTLARNGRYHSNTVTLGARLSRFNLSVTQTGEGAECTLNGLALITGQQLADTHSTIVHTQPHGTSRQLHKCIVDGAAHAVFNGKIVVQQNAQLTDAAQSSRNLLLSARAKVDTKPQLEIFADDVKCAHGATVGQLDSEEVFYLKSRGLDELAARNLLTYAFAAEVIAKIAVPSVVERLRHVVLEQTQHTS
ncbi:MAG TPA: Fe-S cluster assembly protein SufD [Gammaproteobacteria bacterium]|nr:Fe-S cluster assembly protein SufD [Gammaproteobacteria bacterium]